MLDDRLSRDLRDHLRRHPADAGEVLRLVAGALSDYERAQARARGELADKALLGIMEPSIFRSRSIAYTVDAIFHQFPLGVCGHSIREQECWRAFLDRCGQEGVDEGWLGDTRGEECLRWYREVVKPAMRSPFKEKVHAEEKEI